MEPKKTKTIVVKEGMSPANMIQMALQGGVDTNNLKELLDIQKDWEANEAKKAYHRSMSEFKVDPPRIEKDKKVRAGQMTYSHATLANITEKITTALSKHGLSASWRTEQNENITVKCRITHVLGHHEETSLSADADKSGAKNEIQAIGSTVSYLQRYTLLAVLGLAPHDMDDDGGKSEPAQKIDENKIKVLKNLIEETKVNEKDFFKYLNIEKVEDLPKKEFAKAKIALEAKKGKK